MVSTIFLAVLTSYLHTIYLITFTAISGTFDSCITSNRASTMVSGLTWFFSLIVSCVFPDTTNPVPGFASPVRVHACPLSPYTWSSPHDPLGCGAILSLRSLSSSIPRPSHLPRLQTPSTELNDPARSESAFAAAKAGPDFRAFLDLAWVQRVELVT